MFADRALRARASVLREAGDAVHEMREVSLSKCEAILSERFIQLAFFYFERLQSTAGGM